MNNMNNMNKINDMNDMNKTINFQELIGFSAMTCVD